MKSYPIPDQNDKIDTLCSDFENDTLFELFCPLGVFSFCNVLPGFFPICHALSTATNFGWNHILSLTNSTKRIPYFRLKISAFDFGEHPNTKPWYMNPKRYDVSPSPPPPGMANIWEYPHPPGIYSSPIWPAERKNIPIFITSRNYFATLNFEIIYICFY